jgi:ribonuclease Z
VTKIDELTQLGFEGSGHPLTSTRVVGQPKVAHPELLLPGAEVVASDEIRVTVLGSGDPFVKKA